MKFDEGWSRALNPDENRDIAECFNNWRPDPVRDAVQSVWVRIEHIKREAAENGSAFGGSAQTNAYSFYRKALSLIEAAERSGKDVSYWRERLTELEKQLRALSGLLGSPA